GEGLVAEPVEVADVARGGGGEVEAGVPAGPEGVVEPAGVAAADAAGLGGEGAAEGVGGGPGVAPEARAVDGVAGAEDRAVGAVVAGEEEDGVEAVLEVEGVVAVVEGAVREHEAGAAPLGDHVAGLGVVVDHVPAAGGVGERVLARAADDADADVGGALALDVEEVAAVEAVEADLPGLGGVERAAVELLVPVP